MAEESTAAPKIVSVPHGEKSGARDSVPKPRRRERAPRVHSSRRRTTELRYTRIGLVVAAFALIIVSISSKFSVQRLESEHDSLTIQVRKQERELKETHVALDLARAELKEMLEGRLPNLQQLEFDLATTIDDRYVKNVIFSLTGKGESRVYEYRLVMHNETLAMLAPNAEILLFDEVGVQVGSAAVTSEVATTRSDEKMLEPGEIRSYSAVIHMNRDREPRYFVVKVRD